MKHLSVLTLLASLFTANLFAQPTFVNFQMGGVNSAAFTTNNFKCIAVGKNNRIWAGTQYGGLYTYDEDFNIWLKSDKLTNVFINDIKADADSGIWIAQSGQASVGGNSNIAGGINYFPVASDISMNFYSVAGTTTSADLISRNVRSLYIDQSFKAANGWPPRVWAAQGTYITSFNTRRGGLHIGLNRYTPYFTINNGGYQLGPSATPISEAVGGNSLEVWAAVRQNNGGSQILRYNPSGGDTIGTYSTWNVPFLQAGFAAQAIHFDKDGNRWIGLKSGGLVIYTPNGWMNMNSESLIPPGTQVNFNAIASDEYGNVYIGTSAGLLVFQSREYNPLSSPDYVPSYTKYTTTDGLPSNNITGIAYDAKNGRVLVTSDAGVTFMDISEEYIKGVVYDVYGDFDNENIVRPGLQKKPITSNVTVTLLKNNVEEETTTPNAFGIFELKEANDVDVYSVELRFINRDGTPMIQRFDNIHNHTRMKPVLMPDSMIRELKGFKDKMIKKCFPVKVGFGVALGDICVDGFSVTNYDYPTQVFLSGNSISTDHDKKVNNLANYYATLATVYKLGGNMSDLGSDMVSNMLDLLDFMASEVIFREKTTGPSANQTVKDKFTEIGFTEEDLTLFTNTLKLTKTYFSEWAKSVSALLKSQPETQKVFDMTATCISDAADLMLQFLDYGGSGFSYKAIVDNTKKVLATAAASMLYSKYYAGDLHRYIVPSTSQAATALRSTLSYDEAYDVLYNSRSNSLAKFGQDTLTNRKANIETSARVAQVAETVSQFFDVIKTLGLLPGAQWVGVASKVLSFAAKGIKAGALIFSSYQGAVGAYEEIKLSEQAKEKAGLARPIPANPGEPLQVAAINNPDSLIAIKNRFNQNLTDLQVHYAAASFNPPAYGTVLKRFAYNDSAYTQEMTAVLNSIWAVADSASNSITAFRPRLDRVLDSFISQQYSLRKSMYYLNHSFICDSAKTSYRASFDSLAIEIKRLNDSAVNGIASLITMINANNIPAVAYLSQESCKVIHSRVPGTSGSITYKFKNYGLVAQNNVSFKISRPTGGYTITSTDSINVGNINPGETKQVSFTYTAPMTDSVGHYGIEVKANNGIYNQNIFGTLFVIDPAKFYTVQDGDWSNPATWHSNQVPGPTNKVHISHNVTVTTNVTCKSVTVYKPGNVNVTAGKRVIINN